MKGDGDEDKILPERDWFMDGRVNINIITNAGIC
jgi:hypothetical protein